MSDAGTAAGSALDLVDEATRSLLRRYGFDSLRFSELQRRVADGRLSPETNIVSGAVEPLPEGVVQSLPEPGSNGYDKAYEAGVEALRRGEVAVAVLNGGMATRFGGVVKGIVEALDGRSFLEWKLHETAEAGRRYGARVPFAVMNSFATDEPTRDFTAALRRRGGGELPEPIFFAQSVSLRLEPDGALFRGDHGGASPYSPGHGDFGEALRGSGALDRLRDQGIRLLTLSNVDNLGARLDPVVLGTHRLSGRVMTVEVAAGDPGDVGGAPALVDGRPMIVESFRFPSGFDRGSIGIANTNSFVFDLEVLGRNYGLTWLYVEKKVDGRRAVQPERLVNEISAFVPTSYLLVPREGARSRFLPVKTPRDLQARRPALRELLRQAADRR